MEEEELKVGNYCKISSKSPFYSENTPRNPKNVIGVLVRGNKDSPFFPNEVHWGNSKGNVYDHKDLIRVYYNNK